jgi:lactoylglutathione lyase
MKVRQLDHVTLHIKDLDASQRFYDGVLLLEQLPRPAFASVGAWFRLGPTQQLHLIAGRVQEVNSAIRGNHFAVEVDDIQAYDAHLCSLGIRFEKLNIRPDGATQIFITDPDGYVIELFSEPGS